MSLRCPHCGYDLSTLAGTTVVDCPECGESIDWARPGKSGHENTLLWQLASIFGAYGFCILCVFLPMWMPQNWRKNLIDPLTPVVLIIYSPVLMLGVLIAGAGAICRELLRVQGRKAWLTWTTTVLASAFWIVIGAWVVVNLWYP